MKGCFLQQASLQENAPLTIFYKESLTSMTFTPLIRISLTSVSSNIYDGKLYDLSLFIVLTLMQPFVSCTVWVHLQGRCYSLATELDCLSSPPSLTP